MHKHFSPKILVLLLLAAAQQPFALFILSLFLCDCNSVFIFSDLRVHVDVCRWAARNANWTFQSPAACLVMQFLEPINAQMATNARVEAVVLMISALLQYMTYHGVECEILPLPTCEPNKSFNLIFQVAERLEAFKLNRLVLLLSILLASVTIAVPASEVLFI